MKLPGLLPISLLMLTAVLAALLPILKDINFGAIKEWQVLIGFSGTIIAGWIAWLNVGRQIRAQRSALRMNLFSREEDRIEAELPALRRAAHFATKMKFDVSSISSIHQLRELYSQEELEWIPRGEAIDVIQPKFPDLPNDILRQIGDAVGKLQRARVAANAAQQKEMKLISRIAAKTLDREDPTLVEASADVTKALLTVRSVGREFDRVHGIIQKRIAELEQRRPGIRSEIEAYFRV